MKIQKLQPFCKSAVWGGTILKDRYGKGKDMDCVAETWELSFHKNGLCTIDGKNIDEVITKEQWGKKATCFEFFPILVKFIDANQDLSVQVHPSDEYALKHENSYGKTETWYVVDTQEGAGLYLGFKKNITKTEFEQAIKDENLISLLNFYPVKSGECYFIPSQTVHAIGKGCLILEVQQNSDLTYRVYDYGRVDKDGKQRELHVEKAKEVTCMQKFEPKVFGGSSENGEIIAKCEYFETAKLIVDGVVKLHAGEDSFVNIICVDGSGSIDGQEMKEGDSFFVPASYGEYEIGGNATLIISKL